MKRLVAAVAVVMSLAIAGSIAGSANAASKQLWHLTALDQAASEIAGVPITVVASDSIPEWAALTGTDGGEVGGFTFLTADPNAVLFNPYDGQYYYAYNTLFLSPPVYEAFRTDLASENPYDAGLALMVLDHESQHHRLNSGDESRVNACALADMPRFTAKFIPPTVVENVQVPQSYRAKVRYRKKVSGRWVWRSHYVTKVRYVTQPQTVTNPAYTAVLAAEQDIYAHQPPPYNAGTCW
jgi:hypothetical protein